MDQRPKQSLIDFKKQSAPSYFNQINPDGHSIEKEKWDANFEDLKEKANEALEHLEKIEESLMQYIYIQGTINF